MELYSAEWWRAYRKKNAARLRSYKREYDSKRYKLYPEQERARRTKWAEANQEKVAAHRKVRNAIKTGRLVKQPCVICGDRAVAHHDDYTKPLEVLWLCELHHKARHRELHD